MNLEVTLVKTQALFSPVGTCLSRTRFSLEDEVDAMTSIIKFIGDNIDIISSIIPDKVLIEKLSTLKMISADELVAIRSMIAQYNLDIWAWIVSDEEVNASETVPESFEYNVVDELMAITESLKFCTKIVMPSESLSYSRLYKKIRDSFDLYSESHPFFNGLRNPYDNLLESMETIEKPTGAISTSLVNQMSELCKFLGKSIYVVL